MRFVGLIVAVFGLIVAMNLGGTAVAFINLPGLLLVLLVGGGVVVAAHGAKCTVFALRAAFSRRELEHAARARVVAETGIQAFVAAGWIGVLIGVVQMLCVLEDPSKIGAGAATALLTALYGYILAYLFCLPLARSLSSTVES